MASSSQPLALITGASSGLGLELARIHAARRGDLILVARRRQRLEVLQEELQTAHGIDATVIPLDLARPEAPRELFDKVQAAGLEVDYLINNAGFSGYGPSWQRQWAQERAMIDVNIAALTGLTSLFLPAMVDRGQGRILNLGSVAGFIPGPMQGVYFASKAYVVSYTQALAEELRGTGVSATVLCPGVTATEFVAQAQLEEVKAFRTGLAAPEQVARHGYRAMERGQAVTVTGLQNRFMTHFLTRITPLWLTRRLVHRSMKKT
ncbi:MAG: SDR family NAD(P)-dependent oxidoreductase [Candidatus Latescibacteria bacterium]|nr:SDR family NAD(P)-dependent oxidoreductase [Candidatus Latescibacterota bacterium]